MSGLSFAHKINDLENHTKSFIITKMVAGLRRKKPTTPDARASISQELLTLLIRALHKVCNSEYEAKMFSAAFSLAYFSMLRISELATKNATDESGHALNKDNITFHSAGREVEMHVKISSSKTDQKGRATTLVLKSQADFLICPINLVRKYLAIRSKGQNCSNIFFVHLNGSALTKYQCSSILQKSLKFCDVPLHIRTHAFRISRATDMAKQGVCDEIITQNGRWTSASYSRYIRL